ncbi:MarR family winged helix-turn-helix transcriptional regulator [Ottowia thiooxydans]
MNRKIQPGLGELLRYVGELVDQGAEEAYRQMKLSYRPRYTPVLRAISAGAETISEITSASNLTQGAISQSVSLMVADRIVDRITLGDARKTGVRLTAKGRKLMQTLEPHWRVTFDAIEELEKEIGYPLREALQATAHALQGKGFAVRLAAKSMAEATS